MRLADENRIEVLRRAALVLERENLRLVDRIVALKKRIIELEGRGDEALQYELKILDEELRRLTSSIEQQVEAAAEAKTDADADGSGDDDETRQTAEEKKGHGPREQPDLPIEEVVHDLDEPDQVCGSCGGSLEHWEGHDDETEEIDVYERRFVKRKHIRRKRRCKCGCIEMPELPPRVVPGGRYSNDFSVEVAAMKFVDQLPFDRIAKIFRREGLRIDSQTLWDQANALAHHLQPAYERLREEAFATKLIGLDQTPWRVIGHKKKWQMWAITTKTLVHFSIARSKGTDDGLALLDGFEGTVVCDAFATHDALASAPNLNVVLAHCWAHPLREAREVRKSAPVQADQIIGFIKELYDIDALAEGNVERLRELRKERSSAVLERLWEWKDEQLVLPSTPIGRLLAYLENHRAGFERFLTDPAIPLDNNQTERGYLWPAVGRRAFVGSRSRRGTEVAAVFYSLAETARRADVDPKAYFRAALRAALVQGVIPLPHELASRE